MRRTPMRQSGSVRPKVSRRRVVSRREFSGRRAGVGQALASLGLPTVFTFEGGYAVDEVGTNAVNLLEGFQRPA